MPYRWVESPIDRLLLVANDRALTALYFDGAVPVGTELPDHPILQQTAEELEQYFAGDRMRFTVPIAPSGTDFQRRVWKALEDIPYGQTTTYGELARKLGDVKATRAVGLANGRNPISIIVPCHRVIGADGSLVGYGGGMNRKRILLTLEAGSKSLF